jgi:leucyl/phenylalanyl-tRNA---protein transferase
MIKAYTRLHSAGFAHSFETFSGDRLVGGLYGVCIGKAFFGESMFHLETDASKVAFVNLMEWCREQEISVIDAQQNTPHLVSLGSVEIERKEFLKIIRD